MKKITIIAIVWSLAFNVWAQLDQSEYLEAKRLFSQKQYRVAKAAFGSLLESNTFGKYAAFYFGLSAYKQGDSQTALETWEKLLVGSPKWKQKHELLFWLAYVNLEQGNFNQGLGFASRLSKETKEPETEKILYEQFIAPLEIDQLKNIYEKNGENKSLAICLAKKLNTQPYGERDEAYIARLVKKWNFKKEEIEPFHLPLITKDVYDIGVFLPFLFESLRNPTAAVQNELVMDMYQGMLLAAENLAAKGAPVNLWPYDTKKNEGVTARILQNEEVKDLDLIIGPLFPKPNEIVNKFSLEHLINTINPISSNAEVIGNNPLSYLVRPTAETMALKTAELAIKENPENPYAMVFFEDYAKDSAFAALYKKTIEDAGFKVVLFQELTDFNTKDIPEVLTSQYDKYLTQPQADSIRALPGRFVRDRRIRSDEMRRMERERANDLIPAENKFRLPVSYDDDDNKIVYYEKRYELKLDSIGHILAATRNKLYANNLISALESRTDNIKLYTYGDWLDNNMISYEQLDRLAVAMAFPDFIDSERYDYQELRRRLMERYHTLPSINHYRGYEIVWYVGNMMHWHGKYFQNGTKGGGFYPGSVFEGYLYETGNDNKVVPIVRFNDAKLQVVNKFSYED